MRGFECPKCDNTEYETGQFRAVGGTLSKIFDVQSQRFTTVTCGPASAQENDMKKMTPVLLVEEVEPCLAVWERLGFEKTMEVPEGDRAASSPCNGGRWS